MPRRKSAKLYPSPSHSKREYRNYDAEEDGIAVRRDTAWSSHYRVIRSSRAKQGVTTHSYPCVQGEGRDGSIATRRNSSRKIDPSLSLEIENEPRSLEVETLFSGSRSSPKVIINSGKRNRGNEVLLPRHTSKNEIQLRGLTYSGVSKRGRPILLADLPRVIIFESVPCGIRAGNVSFSTRFPASSCSK